MKFIQINTNPNGECFYETISIGLENLFHIQFTISFLKKLCVLYVMQNDNWISLYIKNKQKYVEALKNNKWGDIELEGRIFATIFNIKIFSIEKSSVNEPKYLYNIITKDGSKSYENLKNAMSSLKNEQYIICFNENEHFVFLKIS